ncbi:MAG: hypothetical protein ACI9BK_001419 [Acidimicrobiales bacterium]|jgi:hypothetical protein
MGGPASTAADLAAVPFRVPLKVFGACHLYW